MTEPREALAELLHDLMGGDCDLIAWAEIGGHDHRARHRELADRLIAAGVHLGDEGLRAAVRDFLTYDVDGESDGWTRWDDKIDALRDALAAQDNPEASR